MSSKLFRVILPILVLSLLAIANVSCTYFSPIVGTWRDNQTQDTIQFTRTGNVVIEADNYVITGTWSTVSGNVINLNLEGDAGGLFGMEGADSWQYTISGNIMTAIAGGGSTTFYKVASSTTSTVTTLPQITGQPSVKLTYPIGGETWHDGEIVTIKWATTNLPKQAQIFLALNISSNPGWLQIGGYVTNTGSYKWTVSGVNSDTNTAIFRISSSTYSNYSQDFTILTK